MPAKRSRRSCRMGRHSSKVPTDHPRRSTDMAGTGARYFFLFAIGLVVGVIATVMAMRALEARRDPFPHALMHVQQWHAEQLKGNLDANRCNATDTLPHLAALRSTADDIEHAFPDLADDQ